MKLNLVIDSKRAIPWIIVAVLCGLLIWSLRVDSGEPAVVTERTTDTLVVTKVDTVKITKVVTKKVEQPKDTVFVTVHDTLKVPVPRTEYTFSEEGLFDFKVKGFEVDFLEANVYPKTVYKTITNTVETTIYKDSWNLYFGAGIWAFNKDIVPTLNLTLKTQNRWLFGLNIGYYNKRPIYGGSVNYKILGK